MPLIIGQIEDFNRIKVEVTESEYDEERMYTIKIPMYVKSMRHCLAKIEIY